MKRFDKTTLEGNEARLNHGERVRLKEEGMTKKLDSGQKNLLRLVINGADAEGWAPVSASVFPLVDNLPRELVMLEQVGNEGRGRIRLTEEGENLIAAMAWL